MTTATPASSVYEGLDRPTDEVISESEHNCPEGQPASQSHGQHHTHGSNASQYSHRSAGNDPTSLRDGPNRYRSIRNIGSAGDGDNDGNENPGGSRASWEPDESVTSCNVCHRRFTAFLRRHHCRYNTELAPLTPKLGFVGKWCATGVPRPDISYRQIVLS